jgi:hypothetical protein
LGCRDIGRKWGISPEDNRNFFILKPLLDEVVEELVMCPQMKLSKPVFSACHNK